MALKRKIDATTYNTLTEVLKAEYKADGAGGFVLDTDDATELMNARDREKAAAQAARDAAAAEKLRADTLQSKMDAAAAEAAKGNPDKEKIIALEREVATLKPLAEALPKREAFIQQTLVTNEAKAIATRIFGEKNAEAMLPHVTARLSTDLTGEAPKAVVLDKDGKPTALDFAALEKDLRADTRFSGIVVASKASGAAVPPGRQPGGSATIPHNQGEQPKGIREMSRDEYTAYMTSLHPELTVPPSA